MSVEKCFSFGATRRFSKSGLFLFIASLALSAGAANFYQGISPATVPWTNGIVPYEFTNTLNSPQNARQKQTYLDGLREWELAANVKFIPHTNQSRWILFDYNTNSQDTVSPGYSPQLVTVSSLSRAQVGHEMGHSFGFTHENIRPDQTNYLTVVTNNIFNEPGNIGLFVVDPNSVTNGPYDFESVMHLGWDFASINTGVLPTQQPKPAYFPRYQFRMGNFALSPGDRTGLRFLYGPPATPLTNIVTTTADFGPGSLRAALYYVTDNPTAAVRFNIPTSDPGFSNGVYTIHLTGHLPPLVSNGLVIDGSTQPGFTNKPLIIVDASQIIPETFTSDTLLIYSASNQVRNISLQGFNWNGVTLQYAGATNNTIAGCWVGVDSTGSNAAPNALQGILIVQGASGNIIGGTNALARNVISGNGQYGIWISDSNTANNTVLGNYIGTDASGSFAISNASGGVILTGSTHDNTIGSTNAGARNVISGNLSAGIWITGTGVARNTIQGNFIGLDAAGANAVPNTFVGMYVIESTQSNLVANNVISGNFVEGLRLADAGTTGNRVQGNLIGTDATGMNALPNGFIGLTIYGGASSNTIGGTSAAARNVVSGNSSEGIRLADAGTTANMVQGNFIGTDINGTGSLANNFAGLTIFAGATSNTIGGTLAGARNLISGNGSYGFVASGVGVSGNVIQGNYIGLAPNGSTPVPNFHGVLLADQATANTFGGTTSAARNVVSGNFGSGIYITNSANVIEGNYLGTDATGAAAVPNGFEGIYLVADASSNLIGGTVAGAGNVISGNTLRGIFATGTNLTGNLIQGNLIGTKADGTNALGNGWDGVVFFDGASSNVVGLALDGSGAANTIAFNGLTGFYIGSDNSDVSSGNTLRGNSVYSNGKLGINLAAGTEDPNGVTANDAGDADTGPNNLQNYPVITNAVANGLTTTVRGTLNSAASRSFLIDVYRNSSADPSGYGEGRFYVGSTTATTSGSGNALFSLAAAGNFAGQFFSATATDQLTGDTSEFGLSVLATNGPAPPLFVTPFSLTRTGFTANISLTIGQSYRVQAATNLAANPITWLDLTNFTAAATNFFFLDRSATNFPARFYRVISP